MGSFADVKKGFLEHLAVRNYSPASRGQYERDLGYFLEFLENQGITDIRQVGGGTLKAYQLHLQERKTPKGKPYEWGTRSAYFRAVRRLFDWLERTRQIFLNPAQFIHDGKRERRLPSRILSEEEVERVMGVPDLSTPVGYRDRTIMEVFYSTGIRLNEMAHLKLADMDLEGRLVRVNLGKMAKDRVVPIGETACGFVRKYLLEVRPLFLRKKEEEPQAIWLTKGGTPLSSILIQANFRQYGRAAGFPEMTGPHSFRHAFATHLLRRGADIAAVSKMLGHRNIRVTQIYTHVAAVDVKKAHAESHPREREKEEVGTPAIERIMRVAP